MAQKVHIVLEDDIDGSEASETIAFAVDGVGYEIDLNDKNAAALREALAPYIGHGRKAARTKAGGRQSSSSGARTSSTSAREVRDWARQNGYAVSERGRVPREVTDAFEAAH